MHHLVWEVIDNSIDEHLAGYCTHIEVTVNKDGSLSVVDNGRGIPVGMHEKLQKSALEVVMTVLHAGGKFDKDSYKVSGGLHGVGISCVNALSHKVIAEVRREGKIFSQEYTRGIPVTTVNEIGVSDETGTKITFWPDPEIFETVAIFNQWSHISEKEGKDQRNNVTAINIGVAHDDYLMVTELFNIKDTFAIFLFNADTEGSKHVLDLLIVVDLMLQCFFNIEDLSAQR